MTELKNGEVEVTCRDQDGKEETQIIPANNYLIITTGRMHVSHEQWYSTGTVQLTLKRDRS